MSILRIEALTYGVEDVEAAKRFCTDFGLELLENGAKGATFRPPSNQRLYIRSAHDKDLPPALEGGSTLREVTWGVSAETDLEQIAAAIGTDRPVERHGDTLRARDETGFGIAFRLADPVEVYHARRGFNGYGMVERWNLSLEAYGRARPSAIAHVVLDLPKEGREKAIAFYVERLNFKPVDTILPTGAFLQCEGNIDHHQLFLCHRTNRAGLNHTAFDLRDFDEVIEGGNYMVDQGWKEVRRMGRHTVGSNLYRYFASPCGGRFEYSTDMDKVAKTFPPRVWEESPPHHLWMIRTTGDESDANKG